MTEFHDWELHNVPYIDEDKTIEETVRKWEHSETFNAIEFIGEVNAELEQLDELGRKSAEIYFHTWTDVDGCPSRTVRLTRRRPATEREICLDKAKQVKEVTNDRAWLQQRLATLLEDAGRAGMSAADIGIVATDGGYTLVMQED